MPLNPQSRYQGLAVFAAADAKGVSHPTVAMRLVTSQTTATYQRPVARGDTVESLAAQYYGLSDWWWRISDANPPVFPLDFQPGDAVGIPALSDAGLVVRSRRF